MISKQIEYLSNDENLSVYEERVKKAMSIVKQRMEFENSLFVEDLLNRSDAIIL